MNINTLSKQGRDRIHTGLAGVDSTRLKAMRNKALSECFSRMSDFNYRFETVARIHDKVFINDAASRNANAAWYTLESLEGDLIWITNGRIDGDADKLVPAVSHKVKMILATNGNAEFLRQTFGCVVPTIVECHSLREAVGKAFYNEISNVKVVFAPAAASDRPTEVEADEFRSAVNEL
ncbi:MAG: hypothetical protein IJ789_05775 [Bacteroidales bacterium]|nr:hypothetical protein [Bacteroidales bacterium]